MYIYSYKNVLLIFLFPLYIYIHIIQKVLKFYLYVLTFPFITMEIVDKDFKIVTGFQYAVKSVSYFFVSFLETCKSYGICPSRLNIRKKPFLEFETSDLKVFGNETIKKTEENLLEALCIGICERFLTYQRCGERKLGGKYFEELAHICFS